MRRPRPYKALTMPTDKGHRQAAIRRQYPVQLIEAEARLCPHCLYLETTLCNYGLLPLTLKGEDCPYYQPVAREEKIEAGEP